MYIYLVSYALKYRTGVVRIRAKSKREAKKICKRVTGALIRTMTICEIYPDNADSPDFSE